MDFFQPVRYKTDKANKFKEFAYTFLAFKKHFLKEEKVSKDSFLMILLDDHNNQIILFKEKLTSSLAISICRESVQDIPKWIEFTDSIFEKDQIGITACFYPENDYFWQYNDDLELYKVYNRDLGEIKIIQKSKNF